MFSYDSCERDHVESVSEAPCERERAQTDIQSQREREIEIWIALEMVALIRFPSGLNCLVFAFACLIKQRVYLYHAICTSVEARYMS